MMNISESRLQGLLQYLALLNQMDDGSLHEQKKVICKEIEKELGIIKANTDDKNLPYNQILDWVVCKLGRSTNGQTEAIAESFYNLVNSSPTK